MVYQHISISCSSSCINIIAMRPGTIFLYLDLFKFLSVPSLSCGRFKHTHKNFSIRLSQKEFCPKAFFGRKKLLEDKFSEIKKLREVQ